METNQSPPPPAQMMQMITGFWTSCCIYSAAKLDIGDRIAEKPKTAAQLASETQTHAPSLYRVLRALSSVGVFSENEKGEFELTPLGNTLRSDVPGSMKAMAIALLGDHYSAWGNLLHSIKTGETAFDNLHNMPVYKYYATHPESGVNFTKAMSGLTQSVLMNILSAYDFSSFKTIVDIGGGNGALLHGILNKATNSKGIIFDEEYIKNEALQNIEKNNLQQRCSFEAGSFLEKVPSGASAYLMKYILHGWLDETSKKILENVYKAMPQGSKLLIIESVISERNAPQSGKFMDINMLVMSGGMERTAAEWKNLVESVGLNFSKIIPTPSPMLSIIETEKI